MQHRGEQKQRLYLVDASIYIFRYYFSMPPRWQSKNGYDTTAVYGYSKWLHTFLQGCAPLNCVVCFDESLTHCFRNKIYPPYKSSRALPDEALGFQLLACKQISQLMGLPVYASETHEADDLIGTLAKHWRNNNTAITIVSRDKDLLQLLRSEQDQLWDYPAKAQAKAELEKKWGIRAEQIADFLALTGDKVDDIPGVPGLGAKTAAALLKAFGSWAEIKNNTAAIADLSFRGANKWGDILTHYSEQVDRALRLTTIDCHAPLVPQPRFVCSPYFDDELANFCGYLGFGTAHFKPNKATQEPTLL